MKHTPTTHFKFYSTAAIFDLDGTLTDTIPDVPAASSSYNSGTCTPAFTPDDSPSSSRRSSISSIASIASTKPRHSSFGTELQKSLSRLSNKQYNESFTARKVDSTPVRRRPGAKALLQSLPEGKFGVVSFGSLDYVHDCMSRAGLPHPKVTVTAEDSEGQDSAQIQAISLAAIRMDGASLCLPAQCAVFVNSPEGIREAIADGAGTIIAVCGTYNREQLEDARPHYVVDSLEAVQCDVLESGELEVHVWVPEVPENSQMERNMLPKLRTRDVWEGLLRSKTLSPLSPSPLRRRSIFVETLPAWLRDADVWDEE
ncbi:hypothetical protein D9758_006698 [Tetrapyrgos nigripes]|uniref:Uncharacterized protein n=1 Tax=Tetrapyrgos nigripes TaxID=182062 RepID=A0A8H5LQR5_9AGAR|nr:hypothetical protein D9758_006698 [Tetrapyrgos nigripes]